MLKNILPIGSVRVVGRAAERQRDTSGRSESPISRASGTERTMRSNFATTRVSSARTVTSAWSSPGRSRLVPVSP